MTLPKLKEETPNKRPDWMTESFRCRECVLPQEVIPYAVQMRYGKPAIVKLRQWHLEKCSHYPDVGNYVEFEL